MPRTCTVCTHPERSAIDGALASESASNRRIAAQYAVGESSIRRHRAEHLPAALAAAAQAESIAEAGSLLEQVERLRDRAMSLLTKAEAAGDYRTALQGIREARACIALLLEVEGELDRRNVVTITVHPEWVALRAVILAALAPFPEARQQVAACLTMTGEGRNDGNS